MEDMRRVWTIVAAVAALLVGAPAAQAATFTVTGFGDAGGGCTGTDCTTIRDALAAAAQTSEPDVISLPAGAYTLSAAPLTIASEVTLSGAGARTTTIIAAPNARTIEIGAVAARLERLTVAGGTATDLAGFHGGNIRSQGGTVVLDRVRVTGGSAYSGGGVANQRGTMTILNSLIDSNRALQGGGDGGGVINFSGDAQVPGPAALTIQNSTIAFNQARLAGGLISYGVAQHTVTLNGVTVARNSAGDRGIGGISYDAATGTASAQSTIVAANSAQGIPSNCGGGALASEGSNVESGAECGFTQNTDRNGVNALLPDALSDAGGETDVLAPAPISPAVDLNADAQTCLSTDQRGVARPQGPRCDAGAVEVQYGVRIDGGPAGATTADTAEFSFASTRPSPQFECALDRPSAPGAFAPCTSPVSYSGLALGTHTFRVRELTDPVAEAAREFTVIPAEPETAIAGGPTGLTNDATPEFTLASDSPGATFRCALDDPEFVACETPYRVEAPLADGEHTFAVYAVDQAGVRDETPASRTFVVDTVAPEPVAAEPAGAAAFTFAGAAGDTFECRLEGAGVDTGFTACASPVDYGTLEPGDYAFSLVTIDAAGNRSSVATRAFSVAAPQPQAQPTATPAPAPSVTAAPTPEAGETVVARPTQGKILVKRPGSDTFVELSRTSGIPVGSEVNAKNGRVLLTIEPGDGNRVQRATFYGGIFKLSQPGATLDLTLSEELAPCPKKRKAGAAQSKPKKRKLWGDGKGKFRTKGQYSSATIRGTRWLVEDSCAGTLTRVTQGVVSVRDTGKKRTVLVRAGRKYLAKP